MTVTIKQKSIGLFYVGMEVGFNNGKDIYHVGLYLYGRLLLENYYPMEKKKQADNCYYRYCAKARRES